MTRNLKVLGLALVAVLALNALAASSASATQKKLTAVGGFAEHITGEDIGAADTYTLAGNSITCDGETYTGSLAANAQVTEITVTPTYPVTCKTVGASFDDVSVTTNGCAFVFKNQTNIATDEDTVDVYVECPQGPPAQVIEIHHFSTHANKTAGVSKCTDTIGTQTATGNLLATSKTGVANTDIELHGSVIVHAQTHGSCSFGFTLSVEATFDASATVYATSGRRIHIG